LNINNHHMPYNFDTIINNTQTDNMRWRLYEGRDMIAMTVADMEFATAPAILEALNAVTAHGVFGYTLAPKELVETVVERMAKRHNWTIDPDWIVWTPGLVPAITAACRGLAGIGGGVLTGTPVYHPFLLAPNWTDAVLQTFPMALEGDRWVFDFDALEAAITPQTKIFLLCNPQNPGGTVFRKEELERLVEICQKHNIILCSDEIHCDLILDSEAQHISVASLSKEAENLTITMLAPSKTFNTAGLGCAFVVIPNPEIREKFKKATFGYYPQLSRHGYMAALAAYRDCEDWRLDLIAYLKNNHEYLYKEINAIKGLKMNSLEATYLAWIDYRESGIENLKAHLENVGVGVTDGKIFGKDGFVRMNFAFPKQILETVVERIKQSMPSI
jgi:cysteine-S-conjugate beta-lyase